MKPKPFFALVLTAIIIFSIFSLAVMAPTVYRPEKFERGERKTVKVKDSSFLDYKHGN
jgi:multisubunit Na+/H+ antiporter MnhC subunit